MCSTTSASRSARRPAATTRAPSAPSARAHARPIPLPAPVTRAVRSRNRMALDMRSLLARNLSEPGRKRPPDVEPARAPVHDGAMRSDGMEWVALGDDLDRALDELDAASGSDPETWDRGRSRKWTVGQHTAHVGICLARTAALFEESERSLRSGTLPPPP